MRLMIFVSSILLLSTAHATTIHVPSEQPTIQAGNDAAVDGDTILVASGIYIENILITKGLYLLGEGAETTTIDGGGLGKCVHVVNYLGGTGQVSGFTITNSGDDDLGGPADGGLVLTPGDGGSWLVCDNVICNNARSGILTWADGLIERNVILNNTGSGIFVSVTGNPHILNNVIVHNAIGGIHVRPAADHVDIQNNIIADNVYSGIWCQCPSYNIDCNDVWNNSPNYRDCSPGDNDISADPLFCDADNGDYSVDITSPCAWRNNECQTTIGVLDYGCGSYVCGDADYDGEVTTADIDYLIACYFDSQSPCPILIGTGDLDCNGFIALNDLVLLAGWVYGYGPTPCCADPPKRLETRNIQAGE